MATINLDKALQFLKEQDEKTKAEAIRMSASPHIGTIPSRFIDPTTGTARPGTVAPAPAGADPFVKTKHGFFARNYGPPAGTQGQGGVSMAAQYPSIARTAGTQGRGGVSMDAAYPRRVGTQGRGGVSMDAAYPRTPGTQGRGGVSMQAPYRVPSPRPTFTPGDLSRWGGQRGLIENQVSPGMMYRDPTWAGVPRPRAAPQLQVIPDRNIVGRQPNQRAPSLQQPQFAGRHPPVMRWDAGQTRLPNQRVPSKAQVTVTQEEGKPTKTVTKYDEERDHTLIGQALRRHQQIMESRRQDSARSAGVSMQGIPRTGYPDETIQVSPGDVQIIPRVRPEDVQVIPRGTSYPGGSYGDSLPPIKGFANRVSGGGPRVSEPINTRPGTFMGSLHHPQRTGFRRSPNLPEQPIWNPELEAQIRATIARKETLGEGLTDAGPVSRSAAMRQAYERNPRYGLQSARGWDRKAPFPNPYYDFYGMLGRNEY